VESNHRPPAYQAGALTAELLARFRHEPDGWEGMTLSRDELDIAYIRIFDPAPPESGRAGMSRRSESSCPLERRWSSRRFPYGYLVTT
jgi:hypothetical protein